MNPAPLGRNRQLEDAFHAFNQMSTQLQLSYCELERRVAELSRELAAARSERLRQLAEKERLANRLERLLDALPAGVVVVDGEGWVQDCNPVARDLLGEPLRGVLWRDICERALAPSQDKNHEVALRNGKLVSLSQRSLGNEPGQIILLQDVTQTRAMQETIDRHKRLSAMGEMAAAMAHQIRTPLASALLYLSHLARADLKPHDRSRFAERVLSRLRHMERQVSDMLVFAKGGRFGLDDLPMQTLLQGFRQQMEPQLLATGTCLELGGDALSEHVLGNHEALLGVLMNLATNALQARSDGLRLELALERVGNAEICLRFSDNGPGMDAETVARACDPFFTTRPEGTGLGLAVVQAVVHAHGGRLHLRSEPGSGTTFELYLPLAERSILTDGLVRAAAPAEAQYQLTS